ncbi:PIG-L family deacetylase [Lichenihabitans sp. PAMC28606]|uniref:PIG-L deacetylase family protein n=1 Tax=Lichenihabitans sp. PAMC28606 TaxID=2880932 RepID=UPI001D09B543|nr:PIG-L family deacetylase [Lichenihabitans sp. PAMC28606]UDL95555.1 PIG-L family deacetylase [Lichenihabitans sp. PAMC28606]
MLAGDALDAINAFPLVEVEGLLRQGPMLVLSPHPDDESLGCGGLIAAACHVGVPVDVLVLTDGAGSHPNSIRYPAKRLAAVRREETEQAARALGLAPEHVGHLGLPDTRAPTSGPDFDTAVATIAAQVANGGIRQMFVTWDQDPHCDHQAAASMARAVAARVPGLALWSYPIWGWHLARDRPVEVAALEGLRLDVSAFQAVKRWAIAAHVSQMTDLIDDDPAGFRFTDTTLRPFMGRYEYFIRTQP